MARWKKGKQQQGPQAEGPTLSPVCASAQQYDPDRSPPSKICSFLVEFLVIMRSKKNYTPIHTISPVKDTQAHTQKNH